MSVVWDPARNAPVSGDVVRLLSTFPLRLETGWVQLTLRVRRWALLTQCGVFVQQLAAATRNMIDRVAATALGEDGRGDAGLAVSWFVA